MTIRASAHEPLTLGGGWLGLLRHYLAFIAVANLLWEILQLPLYTIWAEGTSAEIAFAVVHCTAGDLLIAMASLVAGLIVAGDRTWPARRFWAVAAVTVMFGVAYTVFSEWLNLVVRKSWAYSDLMPIVPVIGTGLSPLMQWIAIPLGSLLLARRFAPLAPFLGNAQWPASLSKCAPSRLIGSPSGTAKMSISNIFQHRPKRASWDMA